ncbi:alpha-amylase family protein [Acaryochloris sp. IP29b_bin.137]|uniref:alpha-amylase n=1 Tax=Acaryochloris sp. IP29b_bin.137 TaxID=2969217 RepID=UPI002609B13D|nr:alpha-amylase family protein [Acaryochloris sp. IP29b_bin.137]
MKRLRMRKILIALIVISGLFLVQFPPPVLAQPSSDPRTAFVHLFEWKWTDIANECENHLGPKGYAAVQVSPPNEHAVINKPNERFPWYQRYQPVSYRLDNSRSGTLAEFQDMVSRCNAVGVDTYVDAVINHMTAGDNVGSNGSNVTKYNYPDVPYGPLDFHVDQVDCPECCDRGIKGSDYGTNPNNAVRRCELVGLADLNTTQANVRGTIADYLISLANIGVKGFRVDAAKHMNPEDIDNIIQRVNSQVNPDPYFFLEVINRGNEAVKDVDYFGVNGGQADITEFNYGAKVGQKFLNSPYNDNSGRRENISELETLGPSWDLLDSTRAVIFTDNHDEQRKGEPFVTFKNGTLYDLTNVFMLAWPYGYPKVMSSYEFSSFNQGPPSDGSGNTNNIYADDSDSPNCFNEWKCEHRWRPISNMVAFRNYTQPSFFTTDWWDNGQNQIAFGRGDRGFVVINRQSGPDLSRSFQTSLPAGSYCNVIQGDYDSGSNTCSGDTVVVDTNGQAQITVQPFSAVAIYGGAKLS